MTGVSGQRDGLSGGHGLAWADAGAACLQVGIQRHAAVAVQDAQQTALLAAIDDLHHLAGAGGQYRCALR
ncbi:hypothetical protein D3C71_2090140 [compost metagenome]